MPGMRMSSRTTSGTRRAQALERVGAVAGLADDGHVRQRRPASARAARAPAARRRRSARGACRRPARRRSWRIGILRRPRPAVTTGCVRARRIRTRGSAASPGTARRRRRRRPRRGPGTRAPAAGGCCRAPSGCRCAPRAPWPTTGLAISMHDLVAVAATRRTVTVPPSRQRLDAVADRVLEQRLQQQARHDRVGRQRVHVPAHLQPVAEAQLLDALVDARHLEFLAQRDLRPRRRSG